MSPHPQKWTCLVSALIGATLLLSACSTSDSDGNVQAGALAYTDGDGNSLRDGSNAPRLREPTGCPAQARSTALGAEVLVVTSIDANGCMAISTVAQSGADAAELRAGLGVLSVHEPLTFEADADPAVPIETEEWGFDAMNVIEPRAEGRGTDVLVAVIDTGVELDHPDLSPRLVPGYDYTGRGAAGADLNGHGTHVAGIIAAMSNGDGFTGIAPEADVLPISVLDENGFGFSYAVAQGVLTAVDMGADVINLSLSGPELSDDLRHALDYADEHGVVVIASAGNGAGLLRRYPAAADGVLAVSSIDRAKTLVGSSSYGFHIAFAAPGDDIASISTGGERVLRSGSSMAAAHVSGAVVALRSQPKWGTLTRLFSTAVDLGEPGVDERYGVGLIDLAAAFDLEVPSPDDPDASPTDFLTTTVPPTSSDQTTTTTNSAAGTTTTGSPGTTSTTGPPGTTTTTTSSPGSTTTVTRPPGTTVPASTAPPTTVSVTTVPVTTVPVTTVLVTTVPPDTEPPVVTIPDFDWLETDDPGCWTPRVEVVDESDTSLTFLYEWSDCGADKFQTQKGYRYERHDGSANEGLGDPKFTSATSKFVVISDPQDVYGHQEICLRVRPVPPEQLADFGAEPGEWSEPICVEAEI